MNLNDVIKYPILSEKTYAQMQNGVYTFAVDPRTNRAEVKKVVEFIFDVKVEKVNIINVDKKPKKLGRFAGFTNKVKKAIVTLADGNVINIFPEEAPVAEVKEEATTKAHKHAEVEMSDAEKRAAEKIAAKAKAKAEEKTADVKETEESESK